MHLVLDQEDLKETLLEHSRTHFVQVEGSPFTVEPLGHLLQYDGLTPFSNLITNGRPLHGVHNLDKPTTAILSNLKSKLPQNRLTHALDYK